MNVNEAQYWGLSNLIYKDSVLAVNTKFTNPEDNSKWVTVSSVNNPSGLQAAAVVPLSEWEAQKNKNPKKYDTIVVVARGSESNNALDVVQDWLVADVYQGTGIGQFYTPNLGINQTNEFVEFSQKVFRDQLAPDGLGSFTGHSLGGKLATVGAIRSGKLATTFAAANPFHELNTVEKAKALLGMYNAQILDYAHEGDVVPFSPPGPRIGTKCYIKNNIKKTGNFFKDMMNAHIQAGFNSTDFSSAFKNGSAEQILYTPERIKELSGRFRHIESELDSIKRNLLDYQWFEGDELYYFEKSLKNEAMPGGLYSELSEYEIEDMIRDIAKFNRNGQPYLHDPDKMDDVLSGIEQAKKEMDELGGDTYQAAVVMEEKDKELAEKRMNFK